MHYQQKQCGCQPARGEEDTSALSGAAFESALGLVRYKYAHQIVSKQEEGRSPVLCSAAVWCCSSDPKGLPAI